MWAAGRQRDGEARDCHRKNLHKCFESLDTSHSFRWRLKACFKGCKRIDKGRPRIISAGWQHEDGTQVITLQLEKLSLEEGAAN
jgi:hypothetical protein